MATMRTLISKLPFLSLASRSTAASSSSLALRSSPLFHLRPLRLRPLISLAESCRSSVGIGGGSLRCFSTRPTNSSLNDPSPNWSNRPPKETILLDGCDFEHWLVVVDPPEATLTRDEIIQSYIRKLAEVVGSEEEARMKIYSVSTKHYFAFGALVSEELSYKIKSLAGVRWVLPDSYLNVREKDYGGEPFINGEAVPYDPKYHEEWVRNNARANERSRRNDRPRNQDRSRNFERRRENMQTYQNREAPPMNQGPPNPIPPPPMSYQNRQAEAPPMNNQGPPNSMPPPLMPNNRPMPNRDYNGQSGYTPNRDVAPGYNGGGQGYQGSNPVGGMQGGGPAYQGGQQRFNQPGYQGGGPAYQGGGPPYEGSGQGGSPAYQGGGQGGGQVGSPAYQGGGQGGGPAYQGGAPAYQGGSQGGGAAYQGGGPAYKGSGQEGGPAYQGGSPTYQGGGPSYQPSGPNYQGAPQYQGREVPGRDSQ